MRFRGPAVRGRLLEESGLPHALAGLGAATAIAVIPLRNRATAFLGLISYSLYLVHPPVIKAVLTIGRGRAGTDGEKVLLQVAALAVTIAFAWVFYLVIERPAHRWASLVPWDGSARSVAPVGLTAPVTHRETGATMADHWRRILRGTPLHALWSVFRDAQAIRRWRRAGCPPPPPHPAKRRLIREFAQRQTFRTFVETGTYLGDMVYAVRDLFEEIVSIEVEPRLAEQATIRFRGLTHVRILQGDSGLLLPRVLADVKSPCLFWLDGHFSGGITGRGELNTPVWTELGAILSHADPNHLILIDDARCFTGEAHYPKVEDIVARVAEARRDWTVVVAHDIIRIGAPDLVRDRS